MNDRAKVRQVVARLFEPGYQRILLAAMLAVLLVAGLYPFNFFQSNQVSWLPEARGVGFRGYGEVLGSSPFSSVGGSGSGGGTREVTLELWAASSDTGSNVKDVLSVYVSQSREPFAIEQWGTRLVVGGVFLDQQERRKFRHIGINNVFAPGSSRFVTLTSGPDGTKVYLEGVLQDSSPGLLLERENFDGSLLLGQTASARQKWRGDILGLAFYGKELTPDQVAANYAAWRRGDLQELRKRASEFAIYPFDEGRGTMAHNHGNAGSSLTIPERLRALDPVVLETPSHRDFANISDVVLNILGFIPFGGLLVVYLKNSRACSNGKAMVIAVVLGFLVSLVIELLQVLLPTRDSSLLDLINNTLGTGIGAGFGAATWTHLQRIRRSISVNVPGGPIGSRLSR